MNRTVVGIDVGTTKVCTMVAEVRDDGRVNILGVGLTPSKGLDKGVVVNIDEAVAAISTSVEKAERLSGYRIGTAYVGNQWSQSLVFAILIVILIFRPNGLLGARTREKV